MEKKRFVHVTPPEKQMLLDRSALEVSGSRSRTIRCPRCGFTVGKVYSDAAGHLEIKCGKCKLTAAINLRYFQRRKNAKKALYTRTYAKRT